MIESAGPITLSGPGWVKSAHFASMRASERLCTPFLYELELVSDDPQLAVKDVLGDAVTVTLEISDEKKRHYSGIATSLQHAGVHAENFLYRVTLRPWLWLLSRTTDCRIFQKETIPAIIKKVFRDRGFSDFDERLHGKYAARDFVVQYRESDMHFVLRLMEQEGIYFYFDHEPGRHTLVLCDSVSSHDPTPIYTEPLPHLPYDANRTRGDIDYLESFETVQDLESGATALNEYDFKKPKADLKATKADPEEYAHADYEVYDFPGNYTVKADGTTYATTRLEELKATAQRCTADGCARGLLVGYLFTLSEHTVEALNAEYLVVSQEMHMRGHALHSGGGDDSFSYNSSVMVIPGDRQYRPPRVTPKPLIHGPQTATVVGKSGQEIHTDPYGRVKLRFHWDRKSPGNEKSSCWVRVAQIWAGTGFGGLFTPRINQEVLVEFLEGDPDRPIVTGRVYNDDNKPPYLPDNPTQSGIKTRSSMKGDDKTFNEIRFEDKIGNEQLFIQAEKDKTVNVKNNRSATVGASDSVSVGGSRSVSVSHDLAVSVGTGGASASKMTVTGTHTVDVSDTIDITAKTHIKMTVGKSTLTILPGKITLEIKGGGKIEIDANVLAQSKAESKMQLNNEVLLHSKGKSDLKLNAAVTASSSGASQLLLDGDASLTSSSGAANITGSSKVALVGGKGSSHLDLEAAGATMSSPKTKVAGDSMTEISATCVKIN